MKHCCPHDESVLRGMLVHIKYEIDMLLRHLKAYRRDPSLTFGNNPNVEGFLLHFRVLREFLYPYPKGPLHDDDLCAWEYCAPEKEPPKFGNKDNLHFKRDEINKRLMHLSVTRIDPADYSLPALFEAFEKAFIEFHKKVDPRWKQDLDGLVDRIESELRKTRLDGTATSSTTTCTKVNWAEFQFLDPFDSNR